LGVELDMAEVDGQFLRRLVAVFRVAFETFGDDASEFG